MARPKRAVKDTEEKDMPDIEMTQAMREAWIAEFRRMIDLMHSVARLTKAGLAAGQDIEGFEKARILALEKLTRRFHSFFPEAI